MWLSPRCVVPIVASALPTSRPSRALISEVFPAEPVPKMTTWNSRRSRPARISPSSWFSSSLADWSPSWRITPSAWFAWTTAAWMTSAGTGVVDGPAPADRDRHARRPSQSATDRQQDDQDDQERQSQAARLAGEPLVHLVQRADQPGRQPERGADEDHRQRDIGVRRPTSHAQMLTRGLATIRPGSDSGGRRPPDRTLIVTGSRGLCIHRPPRAMLTGASSWRRGC